jgi:carbon monoxide dehydrogenase subunit G
MKLEQSFEVSAPLDRVWSALIDIEHVAPCLPGAAVTGRNEDGSYNGTFSVKIGPTSASYAGKLEMHEIDDAAHSATMHAHGTDKRGQGGADATIVSSLRELDSGRTQVDVSTDYRITGRLARFGRGGMIEDISEKLLRQFVSSLQESLQGDGPAADALAADALAADAAGTAGGEAPGSPVALNPPAVAAPVPSKELGALSLVGSVILTRLKRNALPAAGVAVAVALVLARRRR